MALKNIKKKEVVKLRQRALANGNVSLFLDINWKGDREYDFLRLYLVDAKTAIDREQNKNTLLLAEQIRAQRLLDCIIYTTSSNEKDREQCLQLGAGKYLIKPYGLTEAEQLMRDVLQPFIEQGKR